MLNDVLIAAPEVGLAKPLSVAEMSGPWWIAHTKSRSEKAFAADLAREGVDFFLPLSHRVAMHGGRRREVAIPLFPSYVFFVGDAAARLAALETGRLCQVLAVPDQKQLTQELSQIERALLVKDEVYLYPFVVRGARCRIKSGPLRGIDGTVARCGKTAQVVLQISMLGQGVAVEIGAEHLELVVESIN